MATTKLAKSIAAQVNAAMRPDAAGADPELQRKTAVVIRHLLEAIEEVRMSEEELAQMCTFLSDVAASGEWRFLTHVFGVEMIVTEMAHGGENRRTVDNVEGPLYRANAPMSGNPALLMRPDEQGKRLFVQGVVKDAETGKPLPNALLDIWQSNAVGVYAEDDKTQPEWNFRRRMNAGPDGRYTFETVVPGCYEIGNFSGLKCGSMMSKLGRHGMRPGHIHVKLSADGAQPMTTMLYFRGEPWLDNDSIFSVRDDVTLDLNLDPKGFYTSTFDFALEPTVKKAGRASAA